MEGGPLFSFQLLYMGPPWTEVNQKIIENLISSLAYAGEMQSKVWLTQNSTSMLAPKPVHKIQILRNLWENMLQMYQEALLSLMMSGALHRFLIPIASSWIEQTICLLFDSWPKFQNILQQEDKER